MNQVRQGASSYASRILEQAKQFEYKMQRICDHYHLPRSVLALHVYYLWELISCDMVEQFSRITELTDFGILLGTVQSLSLVWRTLTSCSGQGSDN